METTGLSFAGLQIIRFGLALLQIMQVQWGQRKQIRGLHVACFCELLLQYRLFLRLLLQRRQEAKE